jgi:hypothetical protein
MDRQFLEFWGNLLLQTARGQKQLEDVRDWWRQGLNGFQELNILLGKVYGLEPPKPGAQEEEKVWEEAIRSFQKSFQDYVALFGYVPRPDYDRLSDQYQALQEKSERQEETIRHLQSLLVAQTLDPEGLAQSFQDLIQKQTGQFQQLMSEMGSGAPPSPPAGGDEGQ